MPRRIRTAFLLAPLAIAFVVPSYAGAAGRPKALTVYAVATTAQFMNHADDRVRGMADNPFNVNTKALVIITHGNEKGNGPFPGDDVLYSFNLFAGSKLQQKAGKAMFTCYYEFVKRATCDAYFDFGKDEVLLASGQVRFDSTRFTLSVTGGTETYLGAAGEVRSSPAPRKAQRFQFVFG